jgi:hypothetical protein
MPEVHLSATMYLFLFPPAAVLAFAGSLYAYRFTVPPIPRALKVFLLTLRALGLFLVFFLIGEPLLSLVRREVEQPVVAVLVDNSKSMTIRDRTGPRRELLFRTIDSPAMRSLGSIGSALYETFETKTHFPSALTIDSLTLTGDGTDIAGALRGLRETAARRNLQCVLLITDGNSTVGANPLYEAENLGVPVVAIGVGDTAEQQDLLVRRVNTNNITYVGNRVPVNVTVKSSGFNGGRVDVTLGGEGKTLDQRMLTLQPGTREYTVPLTFAPGKEGMQKFTVDVSQLPGEISYLNNRSSFYTKVLKSKMRVVLIAGAPSPDVAFVRRALESDKNIALKTFIDRGNGEFYEGPLNAKALNGSECVILVGFPGPTSSPASIPAILSAVNGEAAILFILSRTTDLQKARLLEPVLPMIVPVGAGEEIESFITIPDAERNNPILKLSAPPDVWSKLPPVFTLAAPFRAKIESEVLGRMRIQSITTSSPLLLSRNVNRRKSLAVLGYGIWRWKSYSEGVPGSENLLEAFLSNGVRWLTTREDERPVIIRPVKEMFEGQDPIEFTGQVYNNSYEPIDDAEVSVVVTRGNESSQVMLAPIGNGLFEGALDPLPEGDYTYTARVTSGGRQWTEERGSFSVGGLNAEFLETRMNRFLLQQIAASTGGRYYDAPSIAALPHDIAALPGFRPREAVRSSEIELWNRSWMLALVILLFASEWLLRKRNGML